MAIERSNKREVKPTPEALFRGLLHAAADYENNTDQNIRAAASEAAMKFASKFNEVPLPEQQRAYKALEGEVNAAPHTFDHVTAFLSSAAEEKRKE